MLWGKPSAGTTGRSQATQLVALCGGIELFHDEDGRGYASIAVNGHRENWPVHSKCFKDWLSRQYYVRHKRTPRNHALQDALSVISGEAHHDHPQREVYVRIAEHNGNIYIDLCDERWRVIRITPHGWKIIDHSPVRFVRRRGMRPLPEPVKGGKLDDLWSLINVKEENDRRLVLGWLLASFRRQGPFPILVLQGIQGSAKSTAERVLRSLIDPSIAPLRTPPREERDLVIAANNSWIIALDNLSGLPPWLSDALCRLAAGGGFSTRELYTDTDEILIDVQRPVILNGIDDLATRHDLIDRALVITLPPVSNNARRSEQEFWQTFAKRAPHILGALLDAVSAALRELPRTNLTNIPRMADFALWVTAAEKAMGWEKGGFVSAYDANRQNAVEIGLEASPVAEAVKDLMQVSPEWQGTATELLKALEDKTNKTVVTSRAWPKTPQRLSNTLRRLVPGLQAVGINITFLPRGGQRRLIHLAKQRDSASQASAPSQAREYAGIDGDAKVTISGDDMHPSPPRNPLSDGGE